MGRITNARAYANNEVAYVAWDIDGKIDGCLGFEVTRVYLDANDVEESRVKCAAWVAFKGQKNPRWLPQDTGVWPVQKLSWRDLTVRKKRSGMTRRPAEARVRYEIRPVGDLAPGMTPVPSNGLEEQWVNKLDSQGKPILDAQGRKVREKVRAYEGPERPLGYLDAATVTEPVSITTRRPPFRSTFTNGILAAQWLTNVLMEDGVIKKNELLDKISDPNDPHRKYLAGDVIPLIRELFARDGEFFVGLYELEDQELEDILLSKAGSIHVILANTGVSSSVWDTRNAHARQRLIDAGVDIQHRMFNNSVHIGHNKFVVHVPPGGAPRSVFTGSTNWTSTGIAGQTNNALLIEDDTVAGAFLDYWTRMHDDDPLPVPNPLGAPMKDNQQSLEFRSDNETPHEIPLQNGGAVKLWFSPNMQKRKKPTSKTNPPPVPPDLAEVYRMMRLAKEAIIFLAFYPGQKGNDCIIGEAIQIGVNDPSLLITGAVSSAQAMPNYVPKDKDEDGEVVDEGDSPTTFTSGNVSIVRASKLDDRMLVGDFSTEQLTAKGGIGAIIHDKLVVIDPLSDDCAVILGSHNLGYKASYSNDENMVIVTGDKALAQAYAVHILDVYDHYRFRAIETEREKEGKSHWSGFLDITGDWQDGYVDGTKGALMRYFAR